MSQYPQPSPYSSPYQYPVGYSYDPYAQYLGPARRAGLLTIILGALIIAYGACNGIAMLAIPTDQLMRDNPMATEAASQLSPGVIKTVGMVVSLLIVAVGLTMIVLGAFVRRNSAGATITAIVITIAVLLVTALFEVFFVVAGLAAPPALFGACVLLIPMALLVLQLVWLMQALRAGKQVQAMQTQYQSQYQQYQQQQQAYAQYYGYGSQQPQQPVQEQPQQPQPPPQQAPGGEGGSGGTPT